MGLGVLFFLSAGSAPDRRSCLQKRFPIGIETVEVRR
jgi:hypothetical protein